MKHTLIATKKQPVSQEPNQAADAPSDPLRLGVIPGDGIGVQVTEAALTALEAALARTSGPECAVERFDWSCERYLREGSFRADGDLERLAEQDAILFGAVGWPTVPDHLSLWGMRLAICQGFDQGICVRPTHLLENVPTPLRDRSAGDLEFIVVRENTEGEYSGAGGRVHGGQPTELALQTTVVSRASTERVARYAFELARRRPAGRLLSVTKSNASQYACVLWDEVVAEVAAEFPEVSWESALVDAVAAKLILKPESADVILASNLHADILSDLTAALTGGLGLAPSSNLSCDPRYPSMFEPVHGSAPDLEDPAMANPIGAILSAAMLLEDRGETEAAMAIRGGVDSSCAAGVLTPDLGGRASLEEVSAAVVEAIGAPRSSVR
jgi:tartrate dehydrogenase/decarboxylase/D-malate dehydrogenase